MRIPVVEEQEEQEMPVIEMPVMDEAPTPALAPAPKPYKKPARHLKKWYVEKRLNRVSQRCWFSAPFTDTMEFRPSDAGNYPIVNVNPF